MKNEKAKVKIIPLGGVNEIGKNLTAIEYKNDIVVIDCGLKFPDEDMFGIDLVIPDITYLMKNKEKVSGIFLTHGHEDHIGALPYVLKQLNVPVYGTKLTLGIVETKLKEHGLLSSTELIRVKPRDVIRLNSVSVEFIKTNHSIADSVAIAVHTPLGVVLHTGDFKVDYTPIDGEAMDSVALSNHIEQLGVTGHNHIVFVIGGSLGLDATLKKRSNCALSFSAMTFPHQLMRVILLEQIYRSFRIMNHEPYHK